MDMGLSGPNSRPLTSVLADSQRAARGSWGGLPVRPRRAAWAERPSGSEAGRVSGAACGARVDTSHGPDVELAAGMPRSLYRPVVALRIFSVHDVFVAR